MTFKNLGWFLGPLVASFLGGINERWSFYFAISFYILAMVVFFARKLIYKHNGFNESISQEYVQHDLVEELKIWKIFFKTIWPMLILSFTFMLIDSTFFSIGPLFGDKLGSVNKIGELFITMYTLPGLLFGVLTGVLARPWGKKRVAFVSGIFAGLGLLLMSRTNSVLLILGTTFFASTGLSIFFPEITAVYEDYVARAKRFGNDFIGLTACMASVAYVVGPIINGFLADHVGVQTVFGMWGILIMFLSILALVFVKRKVRLPQKEIAAIELVSA